MKRSLYLIHIWKAMLMTMIKDGQMNFKLLSVL
jgi:hypothetical protein